LGGKAFGVTIKINFKSASNGNQGGGGGVQTVKNESKTKGTKTLNEVSQRYDRTQGPGGGNPKKGEIKRK